MVYHKQQLIDLSIVLPITGAAKERSSQFAAQYPNHLREGVRLNTLAVLVMNNYLYMQGYQTNLHSSRRWHAAFRLWEDTADLEIIGLGYIECRPLKVDEQSCPLPPNAWFDRIAYLLVQLDEDNKQAKLLGFIPPFSIDNPPRELSIDDLQSMDDLMDYLYELELEQQKRILETIFNSSWREPESVSSSRSLKIKSRKAPSSASDDSLRANTSIVRAKKIDLSNLEFKITVEIEPRSSQEINLCLRLEPLAETSLPFNLELILLDRSDNVLENLRPEEGDNEIEIERSLQIGELFSIKIIWENSTIVEKFFA